MVTHRQRRTRATLALGVCSAALIGASCGDGGSLINAGIDRPSVATAASTVPPGPPVTAAPGETLPVPETVPPTAAPTTVPRPLDSLPKCPTEALAAASGVVEITFWHGMTNELGRELERLTAVYNESQDKVHVNIEFQGGYESVIDKYLQSNTNNRPDMVQMPEYVVQQMADTESVIPVQACVESAGYDTTQLLDQALSAFSAEGVQFSMPFNVSAPVLYFLRPRFEAAGLDVANPPDTFDELLAAGQQLVSSGASTFSIAFESDFDGGGGWFIEQWLAKSGEFYANNENGHLAPPTEVLFNRPAGVELLTFLQTMLSDGGAVYVGDNASGQDTYLKLIDPVAPASMTIATSAGLGPVLNAIDAGIAPGYTANDVGVGFMPGPDGGLGGLVGGASLYIADGKGDERAAASWDFLQFLISAESQSQWASATGYVPLNKGAVDIDPLKSTYANDPRFRVVYDQLLGSPDTPTAKGPILGPLKQIRRVTAAAVADVFLGGDPQAALDTAAQQANDLIRVYNEQNP